MAETKPLQEVGGGASEDRRSIKELHELVVPHLRQIYEANAGPDKKWGPAQITAFFEDTQRLAASDPARRLLALPELDFSGFLAYMTSSSSAISTPPLAEDLSWPLASYFISSSHNTYLSGNQLYSDSTTDAYTDVLRRGCRCVEVDVWDGDESDAESSDSSSDEDQPAKKDKAAKAEKKKEKRASRFGALKNKLPDTVANKLAQTSIGKKYDAADPEGGEKADEPTPEVAVVEPRVLHGYTLTKEVSFRDVCVAIRDSAFETSDLPLVVSLEVHCSAEQQAIMVRIMKEVWSGLLVPEPASDATELPSPDQLRKKILIKVKYAPPGAAPVASPEESESADDERPSTDKNKNKKPSKVIHDLSRLGIYTRAISFKAFTQPEATMPTHIFSLSEKKFLDYHENKPMELLKHNKDFLMRAYPSGLRISSSNLNPAVFWGSGTQIVALNWQQADEGMMLNEGMFAGTQGYVLKPPGYRPDLKTKSSPNTVSRKALHVSFTFLAAQGIPLPPDDKSAKGFKPYLKVELHVDGSEGQQGGPIHSDGHEREGEYKSRTKTHKGCDIDLGGEKAEFQGIPGLVEELTFVRFTARDNEIGRDDLAAWACVRLDRLAEGYRFVHLMDSEGRLTEGVVLVKVEKKLV